MSVFEEEICNTCGLKKVLCVCETIAKEQQTIKIYPTKQRFGKITTVIEGLSEKDIDLKDITKKLKNSLACGGTLKDSKIELLGDHVSKVREKLVELGFQESSITVETRIRK